MKGHIQSREAPGFEGTVEGIGGDGPAVHTEEHLLAGGIPAEAHIMTQPALDPPPLVVIAAPAFLVVFLPAAEAVDVELAGEIPDPVEIFDELAIGHDAPPGDSL